jgi:hypothetical protein
MTWRTDALAVANVPNFVLANPAKSWLVLYTNLSPFTQFLADFRDWHIP